jgi:hypothetical protein
MSRGGARDGAGRPSKLAKAIDRAKDLTQRLLDELDAVTTYTEEIEQLIMLDTIADKDGGRRRQAMLRAVALSSRAGTLKQLLAATRSWAELELALVARKKHEKEAGAPVGHIAGGKRAERAAAARGASIGKFAPPAPPTKLQ